MAADRWWRDYDEAVVGALPAGARILDAGCGDGGFVHRLVELGLDAVGVDPRAPADPRLIQTTAEELDDVGPFDAITAMMSLHHVDLDPVIATFRRLLRGGGRVFVYEFAWEAFDERAAAWLAKHDTSGADNSVEGWSVEHGDLHTGATVRAALTAAFDVRTDEERPYLARMLGAHELEHDEQALIDDHAMPALGRWYVARAMSSSS
jgi:SAM-dependent methyltransferase